MENKLMRASEVAKELDVSLSYAYKLIKQLNEELRQKGYFFIHTGHTCRPSGMTCPQNTQVSSIINRSLPCQRLFAAACR